MLRTKQILQLLGDGLSQNKICAEVRCSKRLVSSVKKRADESGRAIGELLMLPDDEFQTIFMPVEQAPPREDDRKAELDRMMPEILKRLSRRHAHLKYVYEDYYAKECPKGYGYTQFKKHVGEYRERNDYSYHNQHEPGKEWQIDFAGDPLWLTDYGTREKQKLVVLVCVMPYSNLPFMMALPNATTEWFFHGLNKGLEFMGAIPRVAKSDNMKQWVTKSDRYSLTYAAANVEWALYYGIEPFACRVRKPRDKGPVEGAVNQLYQYIYARIEGEEFYSLDALNQRIWELLEEYCCLPYKGSTRRDIFEMYEKPEMLPLPDSMYRFRLRKEVKLSTGQLVCTHRRSLVPYGYSTEPQHMPDAHKAYERTKEVNAATLIGWGERIGASVKWAIEDILHRTNFPQQAYGKCNGILSLGRKYGRARLEHACAILREESGVAGYKVLANMLKNNRDIEADGGEVISRTPHNDDVRGASAYTSIPQVGKEVDDEQ